MVKLKRFALFATIAALIFIISAAAFETRVFDRAGLLSGAEIKELEIVIAGLRDQTGRDFVFLADTELKYDEDYDAAESAAVAHAEDFYDYNDFGSDANERSGIIYYLDMENRIPVIITTGDMIDYINDDRLDVLFDIAYDYLANGDYLGSVTGMFYQVADYIHEGIVDGQYRYDIDTGEIYDYPSYYYWGLSVQEVIIYIAIGLVIGLIYYSVVKTKYSLKGKTYKFDLRSNSKCDITVSADNYIRETVTRTPRSDSSGGGGGGGSGRGSGTHTGSSGTSHGGGGGGRRF